MRVDPFLCLAFSLILKLSFQDERNHQYSKGDRVVMWYQSFFPEDNQLEIYKIHDYSYCLGEHFISEHTQYRLLSALQGLSLDQSGLLIEFAVDKPKSVYCKKKFTPFDVVLMSHAINIRIIWLKGNGFVRFLSSGSVTDYKYRSYDIYTNIRLIIHKNNDRIVKLELEQDTPVTFLDEPTLNFTYEVLWKDSLTQFDDRYLAYVDNSTTNLNLRLLAMFNAIGMMIIVMCVSLWILVRTLKYDMMRYNKSSFTNEDLDFNDHYGWKLLHRDVHRKPPKFEYLLAFVGMGFHLFFTTISTALISLFFKTLYDFSRVINLALYMYITFSPLSSFLSSALYKKYGGNRPYRHFLFQVLLFPLTLMVTTIFISLHAHVLHIHRYLDYISFIYLLVGFIFIVLPLSYLGLTASRVFISNENTSSNVSELPGPIPRRKWYLNFWPLTLMSGIMPFGAFIVEMYFLLTSLWQIRVSLLFETAIMCFLVMVGISISTNIISTYLFLNAEDYRWHWLSFSNGFTVGIYFILYTIMYQLKFTKLSGLFQLQFYYSYSTIISICIGVICGSFNYVASCLFIDKIYQSVKSD